jgi:hypothetical protein
MNDVDLALSQISNIRAQLAESTRFRGITPGLNLLMAVLTFVVATVQSLQSQAQEHDSLGYIAVWAGVIVLCGCIAAIGAIARARRLHGRMEYAMLNAASQKVLPFAAAGVIITWVICTFSPGSVWLLPGLWQLLIGLLGFSVMSSLPRAMAWAAGWYFLCGALVLGFAGQSGTLSPWMMGIPFCVGHIAVAVIFGWANEECSNRE